MRKPKSSEELAQQLERETDDEEMWTQEPAKITTRSTRTSVLSLRLPTQEFHALLRAARNAGESVSEYVRKAIAMRQALQPASSSTINVSFTYPEISEDKTLFSDQRPTYTAGNAQPQPRVQILARTDGR
jgi:hypothetical protein